MADSTQSSEVQAVVDAVRHLVRALRLSAREAESRGGLSSAQLFVIQKLGERPDISLGDLAAHTSTDQSSVSVVVRRLVDLGFVSREKDSSDARRLVLRLSRKGRDLLQKAPPMAQDKLIQAVGDLSPADRRGLAHSLQRVIAAMEVGKGSPPMFFEDESPEESKK